MLRFQQARLPRTAVIVLCLTLASCSSQASEEDCVKLSDHITELLTNSPEAEDNPELQQRSAEVAASISPDLIAQCQEKGTSEDVVCALQAKSIREFGKCAAPL